MKNSSPNLTENERNHLMRRSYTNKIRHLTNKLHVIIRTLMNDQCDVILNEESLLIAQEIDELKTKHGKLKEITTPLVNPSKYYIRYEDNFYGPYDNHDNATRALFNGPSSTKLFLCTIHAIDRKIYKFS